VTVDAFRDAIAKVSWDEAPGVNAADAILAMPEMQAIRAALLTAIEESSLGCPYLLQNGAEGAYGPNTCNRGCRDEPECITFGYPRLCESVIDWVLS
jgi:hypothetical protein